MTKREKIIWCIFGAVLGLLFLLSSTDLIIKEKKAEIYSVSVVFDSTSDTCYTNFKKGVEKAAGDFNADVRYVTLYQEGEAKQQKELVAREIDSGAQAVVLAPAEKNSTQEELGSYAYSCPLILLGDQPSEELPVTSVMRDYAREGELLAQAVAAQADSISPVYVFTKGLSLGNNQEIYEGFTGKLRENGFEAILCSQREGADFKAALDAVLYPGSGKATVAALDPESLTELAQILNSDNHYTGHLAGVFGVGSTAYLLNQMDRGLLRGLVVHNCYNEGYLAVERAVKGIRQGMKKERILLESFYIERPDIRSRKFEKMIYPMD